MSGNWSTKDWLKSFGLEQYYHCFIENGYETRKLCANLKDEDLNEMNITNTVHRGVFFNQAELLKANGGDSPGKTSSGSSSPRGKVPTNGGGHSPRLGHLRGLPLHSASVPNGEKIAFINNTETYTTVFDDKELKRKKKKFPRSPKLPEKKVSVPDRPEIKPTKPTKPVKPANSVNRSPSLPGAHTVLKTAPVPPVLPVPVTNAPIQMTKLQLKFKIKDFLVRDNIILSDPQYSGNDGTANDSYLIQLAEVYAEELELEDLNVFDALKDVWRYVNNEKSDYVLPKSHSNTPSTGSSVGGTSFPAFQEQESNYSEPFDSTQGPPRPPKKPKKSFGENSSGEASGQRVPKNITPIMQSPAGQNSDYADPIDIISATDKPIIVKTSPDKIQKAPTLPSKLNFPNTVERASKTLPTPASPNPSTHSSSSDDCSFIPQKSPQSKRNWSPFHRSSKYVETTKPSQQMGVPLPGLHEVKRLGGSMEDVSVKKSPSISSRINKERPSRQSMPPSELDIPKRLSRSISSNPAFLYQSSVQPDSKKTLSQSQESLNKLQSNLHMRQLSFKEEASSDTDISPIHKRSSRVKGLTVVNRSSSELELSTMLEVHLDGQDKPVIFQKLESTGHTSNDKEMNKMTMKDNNGKEDKKKSSLLRRLFHTKKDKSKTLKENSKFHTSSVSNRTDSNADGERSGLTVSTSMPDIANAAIHSEYAEVFDNVVPGPTTSIPPKLPARARPHSAKSSQRVQKSPGSSPPITHHKLMIKSDSTSSNEVIHSTIPTAKDDSDVIEIRMPTPPYDEPFALLPNTDKQSPASQRNDPTSVSKAESSGSDSIKFISPERRRHLSTDVQRNQNVVYETDPCFEITNEQAGPEANVENIITETTPPNSAKLEDNVPIQNQYDDPWKPLMRPKPKARKSKSFSPESQIPSESGSLKQRKGNRPALAPKPVSLRSSLGETPSSVESSPSHSIAETSDSTTSSPSRLSFDISSPVKIGAPPKPTRKKAKPTEMTPPPLDEVPSSSEEKQTSFNHHELMPISVPSVHEELSNSLSKDTLVLSHGHKSGFESFVADKEDEWSAILSQIGNPVDNQPKFTNEPISPMKPVRESYTHIEVFPLQEENSLFLPPTIAENLIEETSPIQKFIPSPKNLASPTSDIEEQPVLCQRMKGSTSSDISSDGQSDDRVSPTSVQSQEKPLTKGKPSSLSGNLLQIALEGKLLYEGIDLMKPPYSSSRGEYAIPSALVSRYSEEIGNPEEEVAKMLDKVRRVQLVKNRRGHIPLKKDWKKFSAIDSSTLETFLTSIGLPQYHDTLSKLGYTSVSMIKGTKVNSLPLKEHHRRRLSAFAKKL